jgi:catechol 2,3-dioxygenase-like lactoylglutathione lyase family enzyme
MPPLAKPSPRPASAPLFRSDAVATLAVRELKAARRFYEDTLGFEPEDVSENVVTYRSGETRFFVYVSDFAGTNAATAVTWVVDDVDGTVAALKDLGAEFQHYDLPGTKREGDVHVAGPMRAAWFHDPDGNILAIVSS